MSVGIAFGPGLVFSEKNGLPGVEDCFLFNLCYWAKFFSMVEGFIKQVFGDGRVKAYLLAGATLALSLGDATLEYDKAIIDGQDVTNEIPSSEGEQKLKVKSTDFILDFGGGVIIPAGQVNVFIEAYLSENPGN